MLLVFCYQEHPVFTNIMMNPLLSHRECRVVVINRPPHNDGWRAFAENAQFLWFL